MDKNLNVKSLLFIAITFLITFGLAISLRGVLGLNIVGTLTGPLNLGENKIEHVGSPTAVGDAATKGFVDSLPKPAEVLISTIPLAGESSVTLSNIPDYPFYEFIITGSLTSSTGYINMQFNGDTGGGYSGSWMSSAGLGTPYYAASAARVGYMNFFSPGSPNFLWKGTIANTAGRWKTVVSTGGIEASANVFTASWANTAQINQITVFFANTLTPNSWLKLYGRE